MLHVEVLCLLLLQESDLIFYLKQNLCQRDMYDARIDERAIHVW